MHPCGRVCVICSPADIASQERLLSDYLRSIHGRLSKETKSFRDGGRLEGEVRKLVQRSPGSRKKYLSCSRCRYGTGVTGPHPYDFGNLKHTLIHTLIKYITHLNYGALGFFLYSPGQDWPLHPGRDPGHWHLWKGQSRLPPAHRPQGCRQNPQQTENQEPGRGWQDQTGDPESETLSPSAHH